MRLLRHPAIADISWRLEERFIARLDSLDATDGPGDMGRFDRASDALRAIARVDQVPAIYRWVAEEATYSQVVEFLCYEGGPDADFDDLVAICQLGLDGEPKLELARNYWDEMGNGRADRVHTELYRKLVRTLPITAVPSTVQPLEALERSALAGLLAMARWLQPEMVGALGIIELQAGPRSRMVVTALERVGAPWDAIDFYEEHRRADPRHGADWLINVVAILERDPEWARRMVRGARWRSAVNRAFFDAMGRKFLPSPSRVDRDVLDSGIALA